MSLSKNLKRWKINCFVGLLNAAWVNFLLPITLAGLALQFRQWSPSEVGLYQLPYWLDFLLFLVIMDFAIFVQHWLFHELPFFWRFHKMHHADHQIDWSSGFRFHPGEIFFSLLYKSLWIFILLPSPMAVASFELALLLASIYTHLNISFGRRLDRWISWILITPRMHLVHHSKDPSEYKSNYGSFLSIWDRLWHSFRKEKAADFPLGLNHCSNDRSESIIQQLRFPLED